jgi:hypothetical protein
MMRIWKTISFIAWRDSGLNKSSKAWQSRASLITKSSQKASSASTLFTHNSKGHENVIWGCKPKPPKIPSRQIESRHDRVKVNEFSVATKSVAAIQMDVSPRRRRDFGNYGQGFRILVCLVPGKQPRQDSGVVIDDGVRDQPRTLVADLDFDIGPAGEFFLAADLCDGGAELVVGLDPVL